MPVETERLQGIPDAHTLVPIRKLSPKQREAVEKLLATGTAKRTYREIDGEMWLMSADGPRYESVGNSFAVECVRWIGERIAMVETLLTKKDDSYDR